MRWLLAMIKHETNTYSPVPTPLERFFRGNPEILAGERAIRAYENTDSGLGGYIEVAPRGRRDRAAGRRRILAQRAGQRRDTRTPVPAGAGRGRARRLRRHPAGPARRHGGRGRGRRRGRPAAPPARDRSDDAGGGNAGHARQPLRRHRQARHRHQRLPYLSARGHPRRRAARGQRHRAHAQGRDQARHALGQQAHAAARDAPGHARRTQQIAAGALHRAGGARRAGGVGVRRLPACRHPRRA